MEKKQENRLLPNFSSEAEEARWWFENQDRIERDFDEAAANGTLTRGRLMRRAGLTQAADTSITLDPLDLSRARNQAERRGLSYESYLQSLIHDALEREEQALQQKAAS